VINPEKGDREAVVDIKPVLLANYSETLMRATLDGAAAGRHRAFLSGRCGGAHFRTCLHVHKSGLLLRCVVGAGATFLSRLLVVPHLARGTLVHVLRDWLFGHFTIYAALPTRKCMPARTRAFLDFLAEFSPQAGPTR